MALHLRRAADTAELADALADLLATPLDDPLAEEVVVVPEHGIERWLAQRLSHRLGATAGDDGVCAGIRFVRPASLVTMLTGREDDDPWLPAQLVWPLLAVIDESLGEPWCAALTRHLRGEPGHARDSAADRPDGGDGTAPRDGRRYAVALRLARLFHRYAEQRPTLLAAWRAGRDEDGAGGRLPEDLRWQSELYRRLAEVVAAPPPDERHSATVRRLRAGGATLDLPGRLSLFGHTRIPVTEAELLQALGTHRDVHLFLPQASPAAWDALVATGGGVVPRDTDDSAALVRHPLLASLGRDGRELARVLAGCARENGAGAAVSSGESGEHPDTGEAPDTGGTGGTGAPERRAPATVLGLLQQDIRDDRPPTAAERAARRPDPADRSLTIHACHGPGRQVEVLREVLVGLMEDDPTLEPRDVLVMCPDVETYAPLIGAAFGLGGYGADESGQQTHPAHGLRVQLADRGLGATNPLLDVAARLVELPGGRQTAKELLDFLALAPVRRRFALDDDDIATLHDWVVGAGIRWGLDAQARAPYRLGDTDQNTWSFGLDRLLTGVAVSADGPLLVGPALPLDDIGSGSIDLVGVLAEAIDRLGAALTAMTSATTPATWSDTLRDAVLSLAEVPPRESWQVDQLDRMLADLARHAPVDLPLSFGDARVLLRDRLAPRPSRTSFRTGALTVCTMVPMRSIPHRVVALLGVDDGAFPRQPTIDGDDLLARRPLTGERDARSEDRQLLLDAVMAARDALVVLYTGADPLTGAVLPPAVPIGELHDAAAATVAPDAASETLPIRRHPLQPFDARNFVATARDRGRPFSFDQAALQGARATGTDRTPPPVLLAAPLPAEPAAAVADVALADLVDLLADPARTLLRDRLGVTLPAAEDDLSERIPVQPDELDLWAIGDRTLRALREGRDPRDVWTAELCRGSLPPGPLAQHTLRPLVGRVGGLLSTLQGRGLGGSGATVPVTVTLPEATDPARPSLGRRVTGTVPGVVGDTVVDVSYGRPGAKPQLRSWVRLLALTAAGADAGVAETGVPGAAGTGPGAAPPTAYVLGSSTSRVTAWGLGPVDPDTARLLLADLVALLDLARTVVLPLPAKTGAAWAEAMTSFRGNADNRSRKAMADAAQAWAGGRFPGEREDGWWRRAYGDGADLATLLRPVAGPGTDLPGLAERVWRPLLAHRRREA